MTYQKFKESENISQDSNTVPEIPQSPPPLIAKPALEANLATASTSALSSADVEEKGISKKGSGWFNGPIGVVIGLGLGLGLALVLTQLNSRELGKELSTDEASSAQSGIPTAQQDSVATASVTVVSAQRAPVRDAIDTTGTVQAFDLLSISPQVSGLQIQAVTVREGDRVNAGQVLAVLDAATLRAQVEQAEAQVIAAEAQVAQAEAQVNQNEAALAEAQEQFDRYDRLFEQGAISEEELATRRTQVVTAQQTLSASIAGVNSAAANVRSAQAEVSRLSTQLSQTEVIAPVSGIIATKTATVGDTASTSTPLFEIISGNQLELAVKVPQTQLAQINLGSPVAITSSSNKNIQLQGSVSSIDPTLDPQTRQAMVKVRLPGSDLLSPGMFLKAEIATGSRQSIVIPAEALQPVGDGFVVYALNADNTVSAKQVDVGKRNQTADGQPATVEITAGLQADTSVVVEGASYLQNGDTVDVVPATSSAASFTQQNSEGD